MLITLIVSWVVFGGVVGLIARAIFPGPQHMGAWGTIGLGVLGSFVGGMIANALVGGAVLAVHPAGWIGSIVGALLVLGLMSAASRQRSLKS